MFFLLWKYLSDCISFALAAIDLLLNSCMYCNLIHKNTSTGSKLSGCMGGYFTLQLNLPKTNYIAKTWKTCTTSRNSGSMIPLPLPPRYPPPPKKKTNTKQNNHALKYFCLHCQKTVIRPILSKCTIVITLKYVFWLPYYEMYVCRLDSLPN